MAIVLLSHNNHLSEVLDHNLRSKIPITCLWPLNGALDHWSIQIVEGLRNHAIHPSSFVPMEWKNELGQIVHGRINWSTRLLTPILYYQLIAFWTFGEHCNG